MSGSSEVLCAGTCGRLLLGGGTGSLPAGQRMCRTCRAAIAGPPGSCSEPGCDRKSDARGLCKQHWAKAYGDVEKRRASWRTKNHRRRQKRRAIDVSSFAFAAITPARELELRRKAKRCPYVDRDGEVCGAKLTDEPYLPNSKELDRQVTGYTGGTYTEGNVRIICRRCNEKRPKDGSDFIGQPTLWAQDHHVSAEAETRPRRSVCGECGATKRNGRCLSCQPLTYGRTRETDGRRAAELRAAGWQWRDIATELGFRPTNAGAAARKYGDPEVIARWPQGWSECLTCGGELTHADGPGRPRKYCADCRPVRVA